MTEYKRETTSTSTSIPSPAGAAAPTTTAQLSKPSTEPESLAVTQCIEDFLTYMSVERSASPGTIAGYRSDLKIFFEYIGKRRSSSSSNDTGVNEVDVRAITTSDLRAFFAYLKTERKNSKKTLNRRLGTLKSFFGFLCDNEEYRMVRDPSRKIRSIKTDRTLPQFLTLEESKRFLDSIHSISRYPERDYAMFLLFLQCGCRLSELVGLTLDSIDLQHKVVRLWGKGSKERIVPLTDRTVRALEDYLRVRRPVGKTDALFLSAFGHPISARGIQHLFRNLAEAAGIYRPGLTVHKLRHTCLTLLLNEGVDLRTLQMIAGHSTIATTEIYTHVSPEQLRTKMEKHPLG